MEGTTELAEIERLYVLMAHYSTWRARQQWQIYHRAFQFGNLTSIFRAAWLGLVEAVLAGL